MEEMTRRNLLRSAAVVGVSTAVAAATSAVIAGQQREPTSRDPGQDYEQSEKVRQGILAAAAMAGQCQWSEAEEQDRQRVTTVGFTDDEATCWLLINRAAAKYLSLPEVHPSERTELTVAIHEIQTRLMWRPTYRKYRELAGLSFPPR